MRYISTRGSLKSYSFADVVLAGLAEDGGLFVPESTPDCSSMLEHWTALSYQGLAFEVMKPFVGSELSDSELHLLINNSYEVFSHAETTPLTPFSNGFILELFHGPTFAFKDIALQFLGNLFEILLQKQTEQKKTEETLNIVGATSGDTGSAAIYAVRGKKSIQIFMLHPKGKVSKVQEMQMTTVLDPNVHNIAIEGDFDDCQAIVKSLLSDLPLRKKLKLGAVNSINWARILAQMVYYFYAGLKFLKVHPKKPLIFSVPTGNFGDVFAGYMAKKMGLPISQLIVATNANDIVKRVIETGDYHPDKACETFSPAMDIQISSNFERLLFDLTDRNGATVSRYMTSLKEHGGFNLSEQELDTVKNMFKVVKITDEETLVGIQSMKQQNIEVDPHTAVGIVAARKVTDEGVICLATAHPAKFPEVVQQAIGEPPGTPIAISDLADKQTRCDFIEANAEAVVDYIQLNCNSHT